MTTGKEKAARRKEIVMKKHLILPIPVR